MQVNNPFAYFRMLTLLVLFFSVYAMKGISFQKSRSRPPWRDFFLGSPVFSTVTWFKRERGTQKLLRQTLKRFLLFFFLSYGTVILYHQFIGLLFVSLWIQAYLALIPVYLIGQFLSLAVECLLISGGWQYPAHFQYPYLSRSLGEFWGKRWARWMTDWLNQIFYQKFKKRPHLAVWMTFVYSGFWHELLLSLPLFVVYRIPLFGQQILYFALQALGTLSERRIKNPLLKRVHLWAFVLIPAPLVINQAVLLFLGFKKT